MMAIFEDALLVRWSWNASGFADLSAQCVARQCRSFFVDRSGMNCGLQPAR